MRYNMVMLFELLRWWYGPGWEEAWRRAGKIALDMEKAFSVGVLVRTLFSPWKQIVSVPGRSVGERFQALVDNVVSRAVGFFVRLLALLAALIMTFLAAVFGLAAAVSWPLIPALAVYFLIRGIAG